MTLSDGISSNSVLCSDKVYAKFDPHVYNQITKFAVIRVTGNNLQNQLIGQKQ